MSIPSRREGAKIEGKGGLACYLLRLVKKDIPFPLFPCPSAVAPIIPSIKKRRNDFPQKISNVDGHPMREKGPRGLFGTISGFHLLPLYRREEEAEKRNAVLSLFFFSRHNASGDKPCFLSTPIQSLPTNRNFLPVAPLKGKKRKEKGVASV